jgi:hypothetical protein
VRQVIGGYFYDPASSTDLEAGVKIWEVLDGVGASSCELYPDFQPLSFELRAARRTFCMKGAEDNCLTQRRKLGT